MACDLLQGLDLEALSPQAMAGSGSLQLPDGLGSATYAQLFPRDDPGRAARMRRCPQRAANRHGLTREEGPQHGPRFAEATIAEFRHFWRAQLDGDVPAGVRLQVDVPTPYTFLVASFGEAEALERLPATVVAVRAELAFLLRELPPEHLALQWDACAETRVWETRGRDLAAPRGLPERLLESLVSICEEVPAQMELGFHLCHRGGAAIIPADGGQATRLLGAIVASIGREPDFVHLPVPAEADAAYFEPLGNLALWPQMQVGLGLLHPQDGSDGAARRLAAAQAVLPGCGVGPACGSDAALSLPLFALLQQQEKLPR